MRRDRQGRKRLEQIAFLTKINAFQKMRGKDLNRSLCTYSVNYTYYGELHPPLLLRFPFKIYLPLLHWFSILSAKLYGTIPSVLYSCLFKLEFLLMLYVCFQVYFYIYSNVQFSTTLRNYLSYYTYHFK